MAKDDKTSGGSDTPTDGGQQNVIGKNTVSGQMLQSFVERIERLTADKKDCATEIAAVVAEAKAAGFQPKALRYVIKKRSLKPHDLQEFEALTDLYWHALGHGDESPLFRHVGLLEVDIAAREEVIAVLSRLVPANGSITVEAGGKPIKLVRDDSGEVSVKEVADLPPRPLTGGPAPASTAKPPGEPPPNVDADGAEALGRTAFKENVPIIRNPFPFADLRRPRWDAGWRKESGGDGMGPEEKKP